MGKKEKHAVLKERLNKRKDELNVRVKKVDDTNDLIASLVAKRDALNVEIADLMVERDTLVSYVKAVEDDTIELDQEVDKLRQEINGSKKD